MENTIIGVIGGAVGIVGLLMFIRMLAFRLGGEQTLSQVISSRQDSKGRYIHRVKYLVNGTEVFGEDSEAYIRPLESGTELPMIYSKSQPEQCKSLRVVNIYIIGCGILALMGGTFVIRFLIL